VKRVGKIIRSIAVLSCLASAAVAQVSPNDIGSARMGMQWEQGHSAAWHLDQHNRLTAAFASLKPERKGKMDAFVLVVGLDADPVFNKEAAEAANVLTRRYNAAGHMILLSSGSATAAAGSPSNIAASLATLSARMDKSQDVLILYATAHGAPGIGVVYKETNKSYGMIAPERLAVLLDEVGIKRRVILVSACFSGEFLNVMANPDSVIVTAAADDRTSFGCAPGNDWTFFGDALINNALRTSSSFQAATEDAFKLIAEWEFAKSLTPSSPRFFIGDQARVWLGELDKAVPTKATPKVGRPALEDSPSDSVGR
jgi:Peptidase C13 family